MLFNVPYWEWVANIIGIVLAFLLSLPNGLLKKMERAFSSDHLHQLLNETEIENMILLIRKNSETLVETKLSDEENRQIIVWVNQAKVIDKVPFPISVEKTAIHINSNDEKIEIQPFKNELAIQRIRKLDQPVSYWVRQPELTSWLENVKN